MALKSHYDSKSFYSGPKCSREDCPGDGVTTYNGQPVCDAHFRYLTIVGEGDKISSTAARKWLLDRGIVNEGMTKAEWQKATAKYRSKVGNQIGTLNKDWALAIKTKWLDGEPLLPIQKKNAQEALGEKWEEVV